MGCGAIADAQCSVPRLEPRSCFLKLLQKIESIFSARGSADFQVRTDWWRD